MSSTTIGVKLDENTRQRLKDAATRIERTPHWLIKQSIFTYLEKLEQGVPTPGINDAFQSESTAHESMIDANYMPNSHQPFLHLAQQILPQSALRANITAHYRTPETECVPALIAISERTPEQMKVVYLDATRLMEGLRQQQKNNSIVQNLIQEFSLSSQEGVALMCLAEALLRIPDKATRDALIRDKISNGNWRDHLGHSSSLFVNAATWGLLISGKLVATRQEESLGNSLTKLLAKGGEPIIRKGVDVTMRLMGEQFVSGQTIGEALNHGKKLEEQGFNYSYDMLGEAALTEADAQRYYAAYEHSIHAIGAANQGKGIYLGSGISIKLSALYPRYSRLQYEDTINILYPRLLALVSLAKQYDIGLNIDAEETERLELSLDLLERLVREPSLAKWNGIGFVVQAYQKRAPYVIDYLIDLAKQTNHRLMVRLVKGAYWDSEIKKSQQDGQLDYPVYTRKYYTDVSYLACANKMLQHPEAIYSQFATHNAMTVAAIMEIANSVQLTDYEFQCLHGMGETLYVEVIKHFKMPCRIYAPVGTHETLLPYLVRRLLENGANSSFVNQIANLDIPLQSLLQCPIALSKKITPLGTSHERIPKPAALFSKRKNSTGLDIYNEQTLARLSLSLLNAGSEQYTALPCIAGEYYGYGQTPQTSQTSQKPPTDSSATPVTSPTSSTSEHASLNITQILNPANHTDQVGIAINTPQHLIATACSHATQSFNIWSNISTHERALRLERAADLLHNEEHVLLNLLVREAGKSLINAHAEVREAIDFLRYYAQESKYHFNSNTQPELQALGAVLCISPWNFPLAIFLGQIAAALAAGNTVLAKPAEQTPLIAAKAIELLYQAGIPKGAIQLMIGDGAVGAALVANPHVQAVLFTGSTEVAKRIQAQLATRLTSQGQPIVLIAETGGQNAMIVDSSALAEQVVNDVIQSSFDSAGQRCSALRVLCLQEESADLVIELLKGGLEQLKLGNPEALEIDIGPVIDQEAQHNIQQHIAEFSKHVIYQKALPEAAQFGTFCAPTIIELTHIGQLKREIFGPVLHIVRYQRNQLPELMQTLNDTGYGLTMGIHSRINETIEQLIKASPAGNIYVNRNIVGAVVGVQPFGGRGLSGTGPKAGGPLYLSRLLAQGSYCPAQRNVVLEGPTGERNSYELHPRGAVLCYAKHAKGLIKQLQLVLNTDNIAHIAEHSMPFSTEVLAQPTFAKAMADNRIQVLTQTLEHALANSKLQAVLADVDADILTQLQVKLSSEQAKIISVFAPQANGEYQIERLFEEVSISVNTAAAGGNASLMTL